MQKRLYLFSVITLVAGLCCALLIYVTAGEAADDYEGSQVIMVDGKAYPIPLAETKMYRRELQRFGGKMALLFDDLSRWFAGLWRGRSLAVTVVWITASVSLVLFLLARQMPPDPQPAVRAGDHQDKAG